MKKFVAIAISIMMVFGSIQAFAMSDYGDEWYGYSKAHTARYNDVSTDFWAYDSIMRVSDKGWFSGYPDNTFRPNASITRAEALKVFDEFLGLEVEPVDTTSFYDVDADEWYAPYIEAGKDLFPTHITVQGKKPFNPDMPVTREDTIYALVNALGCMEGVKITDQSVLNMFRDKNSISDNIKPYFVTALNEELVSGYEDRTIRAQDPLNRAEFATLLMRGSNHGFHNLKAKINKVNLTTDTSLTLEIGDTLTIRAKAAMTDGTSAEYINFTPYIASGKSVISISEKTVTAIAPGKSKIKFEDEYLDNTVIEITVKAPETNTKIKIYNYPEETSESTAIITGKVIDDSISDIDFTCNGRDIQIGTDGSFSISVNLKNGDNSFKLSATNKYSVSVSKTITILKTTVEGNAETNDTTESENNYQCDPSQGINAGVNSSNDPGPFTPDDSNATVDDAVSGIINGPFNLDEYENEITEPNFSGKLRATPLNNLTSISNKMSTYYGSLTDNYGNRYDFFCDCGSHAWNGKNKLEYLLDYKYKTLKGTIYVPNGESYNGTGYVQILADNNVIYTSPEFTKSSRPIPIEIGLSDCNNLVIQFVTNNMTLCLGNPTLYGNI